MKNSVTLYRKIRNFIGIEERPSISWSEAREIEKQKNIRMVNNGGVWSYRVAWLPVLRDGFRRLSYAEFCQVYNLEMISV